MPNGSLHDVPSTPVRSPLRSRPTGILLVAVALCLLILGGGGFFLHHQIQGLRAREQNDLMAIADLKAGQISAWYANQRHQAERLFRNRLLRGPVTEVLGGKATAKTRADLQAWMNDFRMDGYSRILLLDRMGRICLQSPEGAPPAPDIQDRAFQTALASSGVRIEDLHREPKAPGIHLNVWVPVTGSGGGPNEGVFLLQMDTARFLAPFIESWPEPSASAETQLVRRSGDSVEYLNDQRFRPHSALSLKIPLAEHPDHPAVLAAEGREGLVAGPDYRNVRVLAALRRIPGTPWSLVAKIDEAEIFRSARTEDWMGAFILIGLVVLVVTGAALIFREVQLKETRAHLRLEQEARIANDRYRSLLEQASDVILLLDLEGRILEANPRVLDQYGYTPEELVGTPGTRLRAPGSKESLAEDLDHLRAGEPMQYETLHCRRDGSVFPVEISTRMVHLDGQPCFLGFIRDITERKAQEREIQRMTRLYSALSQVNQAIVWSATREALLSKICEVMVEFGGFSLAWIGWDDPVTHRVSPVAHAGDRWDIMARVVVRSDDTPDGHGPLGTAIREGTAQLLNDYAAAPESKPWRTFLEASGLSSIAAFPIRQGGRVVGGLAVYSTEKGFFGTHEMALLEEAAMDISFALDHLAGEAQRQMAEQALRESEAFLREAEEAGGVGCYTWDLLEDRWVSSEPLDRMFGIGPVHPRNLEGWMSLVVPSHREELKTYVAGLLGEGTRFDHEYPIQRPSDGALRWLHGTGALRRDASGQPAVLTGVIRDITDRKEREGELTRLTRLYAALSHVNQAIVRSRDRQELLDHICEAMVEQGRFTMAWVGWDDPATHVVRVQARYGDVHG
ncbi:MAG TPA: PAS domain S-box protein, partial [Holophagaceae bacterium]